MSWRSGKRPARRPTAPLVPLETPSTPAAAFPKNVAVGKAAVAMTHSAVRALGDAIISGDVITKDGHVGQKLPSIFRVHESGHPIPDERGVRATRAAVQVLEHLSNGAVVVALISGG